MKLTFFVLLILLATSMNAQKNKFGARLEITPSFTTVSGEHNIYIDPVHYYQSGNIFAKGLYGLGDHVDLTTGIGYLNTKQYQVFSPGFEVDVYRTEDFVAHQYLTIPAGLNFHFGAFFISPEIGAAFAIGHRTFRTNYSSLGNIIIAEKTLFNFTNSPLYKKVTVPLMISFGGEVTTGFCKILFGAKAYYSLNEISTFNKGKYFGFGFMTGVKF